jgi:hypothetical protein
LRYCYISTFLSVYITKKIIMKTFRKTLSAKSKYLAVVLVIIVVQSCNSQTKCPPCPASPSVNPNINFRIIDQATGADLFFATQPKYTFAQIKIRHVVNGKPDTAYLRIDANNKFFNLNVPTVHLTDTVTFQIGSQTADVFLFDTSTPDKCCPFIKQLNTVRFDGNAIYANADGTKIIEIKK